MPAGERRKGAARTVDLMPTLLGRLGLEIPAGLDGVDLLGSGPSREAYAETLYPASFGWSPLRSFRMGSLKLVDAPRPELYDLAADPREADDIAARRAEAVERLRQAPACAPRARACARPPRLPTRRRRSGCARSAT